MVRKLNFLIDTNVVIGLEDPLPVKPSFADFVQACARYGCGVFIDNASEDDARRDANAKRRAVTLSKLRKFQRLAPVPQPAGALLEARFGRVASPNDRADVRLLVDLAADAAHFLVTEDWGLHTRAARAGLGDRTLTVAEALELLQNAFEPKPVAFPFVVERAAYQLEPTDPIFESLRADYAGFDEWFTRARQEHRSCWVLEGDDGAIAGVAIRKDETAEQAGLSYPAGKVLKICTFKIDEKRRGQRLGELLLKQVLWWAQRSRYEAVYLTTYSKHEGLINLLKYYGFKQTGATPNGEIRLEKALALGPLPACRSDGVFDADRLWYPRYHDSPSIGKFIVPIRGAYHAALFPEAATLLQGELFPPSRVPGNTIRKVYLSRARISRLTPGAILVFYLSKDFRYRSSQCVTTVGVVERVEVVRSFEELVKVAGKRSVYTDEGLIRWEASSDRPVRAILFLLAEHLTGAPKLPDLVASGALKAAPQTISVLSDGAYAEIRRLSGGPL